MAAGGWMARDERLVRRPGLRVLVTGARGFIGRQVAAAIRHAGHEVVAGVRKARTGRVAPMREIDCDFSADLAPADWSERLVGIDAVVNCVGILRERGHDRFESVHVTGPVALFRACELAGIRRVVQVSALGSPEDGEFVASKHRGDAALAALDLDWVVLRPSVVYAVRGSYGGTSLLRAMAALPVVLPVPGNGRQPLDPVCAEDLAEVVVGSLEGRAGQRRIVEVVGPQTLTLEGYLTAWRDWLGLGRAMVMRVPPMFVTAAAGLGEVLGTGPLGRTMYRMLERGNTGATGAVEAVTAVLGRPPRSLQRVLDASPAFVQDRWHARLYFVGPLLRVALGVTWVASGVVGLMMARQDALAILSAAGLPGSALPLLQVASGVDIGLGVLSLRGWRPALTGALMLLSVLAYTAFIGIVLPSSWMDPLGGLLKNIVLVPALLAMMALAERR